MNKIPNYNNPVVSNIPKLIERKGMKQRAVAESVDLTPQAFCDVLNGRRLLKISEVNGIAKTLGVDVGELFKTDDSA